MFFGDCTLDLFWVSVTGPVVSVYVLYAKISLKRMENKFTKLYELLSLYFTMFGFAVISFFIY